MPQHPGKQLEEDALLGGLDALAAAPDEELELSDDTVTCRVCHSQIDTQTGEPLSPVTEENVRAVQQFETEARQAQQGGQVLDLELPGLPGLEV